MTDTNAAERLSFVLVLGATFTAGIATGWIIPRLLPLPPTWLLQVIVFLAVAALPVFLVEWLDRLAIALNQELKQSDHERWFHNPGAFLGIVERVLFLGALVGGYPEFVAVWFVFKGIAGWREGGGANTTAGRRFQLLLLNNAVSLAGVALGWMVWSLLDLPRLHR